MSIPRISIVTPSFNQGPYLEETIDSIHGQGYPNLEHIVIDGGSSDESVRIIERHAPRLAYWVSEKDRGQADALNKGFARATGDIFGFINSDDLLEPGTLARLAELFGGGARWVAGAIRCFGAGRADEVMHVRRFDESAAGARAQWLGRSVVWQQGSFWAGDLTRQLGGFRTDLHYVFDWEFWLRLRLRGGVTPVVVDEVLGAFRLHEDSKTMSRSDRFEPELAAVRREYRGLLPRRERWRARLLERRCIAEYFQSRSVRNALSGRPGAALADVGRSLAWWPALACTRRTAGALRLIARPRSAGAGPCS